MAEIPFFTSFWSQNPLFLPILETKFAQIPIFPSFLGPNQQKSPFPPHFGAELAKIPVFPLIFGGENATNRTFSLNFGAKNPFLSHFWGQNPHFRLNFEAKTLKQKTLILTAPNLQISLFLGQNPPNSHRRARPSPPHPPPSPPMWLTAPLPPYNFGPNPSNFTISLPKIAILAEKPKKQRGGFTPLHPSPTPMRPLPPIKAPPPHPLIKKPTFPAPKIPFFHPKTLPPPKTSHFPPKPPPLHPPLPHPSPASISGCEKPILAPKFPPRKDGGRGGFRGEGKGGGGAGNGGGRGLAGGGGGALPLPPPLNPPPRIFFKFLNFYF